MTADDLLSRTILYKVGHHGSHNATDRADPRNAVGNEIGEPFGLELMKDMIPVDGAAARKEFTPPKEEKIEPWTKGPLYYEVSIPLNGEA